MIHEERIKILNRGVRHSGQYVLYWMQAAQRANCNHALEYAIRQANEKNLPLIVFFGITAKYPEANLRHYRFMLEGLPETRRELHNRGIRLVVQITPPGKGAIELAKSAALLVADRGYTRIQKQWRETVAVKVECPVVQVETEVIVPIDAVSHKEEFAARTIRPKIENLITEFLKPLKSTALKKSSLNIDIPGISLDDIDTVLSQLDLDSTVPPSPFYRGGTNEAETRLSYFIKNMLKKYDELRNDPALDYQSGLGPYLHFGQISPLTVALKAIFHAPEHCNGFLEELITRRELSMNFVNFNPDYDSYDCLNNWAKQTLAEHSKDTREYLYPLAELEAAKTHDPYWNAAQTEMAVTGKMHGHMRMYWGKKILEWSKTPREAFAAALYLNNKYELDGRDPNGFTGVAWCFGKHDRPWGERKVFGKVRYMNAKGLERKFNINEYVARVDAIINSG